MYDNQWHAKGLLSGGYGKRNLLTGLNKAINLTTSHDHYANFTNMPNTTDQYFPLVDAVSVSAYLCDLKKYSLTYFTGVI